MNLPKKQLKKKITQYKKDLTAQQEKKEEIEKILESKKNELNLLRNKFLSTNSEISNNFEKNADNLILIYKNYKRLVEYNDNIKKIEYGYDTLKRRVERKAKHLEKILNDLNDEINKNEDEISKTLEKINNLKKDKKITFKSENYIINPIPLYVDNISELCLEKKIHLNLKNNIVQIKKRRSILLKETEKERKYLIKYEKKISNDDQQTTNNTTNKSNLLNKENSKEEKDNDTIVIDDLDNCLNNDSIVLDLTKRKIEQYLDSPRFIDKIIYKESNIKPIKNKLERHDNDKLATNIKIKHIDIQKESIVDLDKEINESKNTIKNLEEQIDNLNKQIKKNKAKIPEYQKKIKLENTKIEILHDEIKMIKEQIDIINAKRDLKNRIFANGVYYINQNDNDDENNNENKNEENNSNKTTERNIFDSNIIENNNNFINNIEENNNEINNNINNESDLNNNNLNNNVINNHNNNDIIIEENNEN